MGIGVAFHFFEIFFFFFFLGGGGVKFPTLGPGK